ncbi:MAG: extracellular solute-binding protein [Oscillospiraceae bacterium]|nr:extracellular solute-binding protein [Oscillospiraceae bacterium]
MKKTIRVISYLLVFCLIFSLSSALWTVSAKDDEVVLRICNWEEYIDEGEWDEDEVIDLDSGDIFGENSVLDDFSDWYYEVYGKKVRVEYSTFGTNEDLYNMLTLGDVYDLVCPSEYMIMKLMADGRLYPLSDDFFDENNEHNYYINGVSPYIRNIFETHDINGETWDKYAAGYMWGVTGFVFNPDEVSYEEASTWHLLDNSNYYRQITVKDNVRDTYFAAVGALKSDLLTDPSFVSSEDYLERLQDEMNDTSPEMIEKVQEYLQSNKDNYYSFETDSGKTDLITGKVVANYQWSGDAVYTLDQAELDDYYLEFAVPIESTNVYFDGWVMLRSGVEGDSDKQHAAEAFINFMSRPDIAIRNMYYIGYTSVIAASEDGRILEYADWNYSAEDDEEDTVEYSVANFFAGEGDDPDDYVITIPEDQLRRQMVAAYPSEDILNRACIMVYFDSDVSEKTNQMWINVRCYNIRNVPAWAWVLAVIIICLTVFFLIRSRRLKNEEYGDERTRMRKDKD